MPSLADFGQQPNQTPAGIIQAGLATNAGLNETEAGLRTSRLTRNFLQRRLPRLASSEAAAGRFFSTGAQNRARELTEDTSDAIGDVQRQLSTNLADLTRGGILAQMGIQL